MTTRKLKAIPAGTRFVPMPLGPTPTKCSDFVLDPPRAPLPTRLEREAKELGSKYEAARAQKRYDDMIKNMAELGVSRDPNINKVKTHGHAKAGRTDYIKMFGSGIGPVYTAEEIRRYTTPTSLARHSLDLERVPMPAIKGKQCKYGRTADSLVEFPPIYHLDQIVHVDGPPLAPLARRQELARQLVPLLAAYTERGRLTGLLLKRGARHQEAVETTADAVAEFAVRLSRGGYDGRDRDIQYMTGIGLNIWVDAVDESAAAAAYRADRPIKLRKPAATSKVSTLDARPTDEEVPTEEAPPPLPEHITADGEYTPAEITTGCWGAIQEDPDEAQPGRRPGWIGPTQTPEDQVAELMDDMNEIDRYKAEHRLNREWHKIDDSVPVANKVQYNRELRRLERREP